MLNRILFCAALAVMLTMGVRSMAADATAAIFDIDKELAALGVKAAEQGDASTPKPAAERMAARAKEIETTASPPVLTPEQITQANKHFFEQVINGFEDANGTKIEGHADAKQIAGSPEFKAWLEKQSNGVKAMSRSLDPLDGVTLLDAYKEARALAAPVSGNEGFDPTTARKQTSGGFNVDAKLERIARSQPQLSVLAFWGEVERLCPGAKEIENNARATGFKEYLNEIDAATGLARRQLANNAYNAQDAALFARFFIDFKAAIAATEARAAMAAQQESARAMLAQKAEEARRQQESAIAATKLIGKIIAWCAILLAGFGLAWFISRSCWRAIRQIKEKNMARSEKKRLVSRIANRAGIALALVIPAVWIISRVARERWDDDKDFPLAGIIAAVCYTGARLVGWVVNGCLPDKQEPPNPLNEK